MSLAAAGVVTVGFLAATFYSGEKAMADQPVAMKVDAPDFEGIDEWINTKAVTWKDLKGQVVVLHFWTFG